MKHLALVLAFAACSKSNDVTLLLGPSEDRVSRGFTCKNDAGDYLMQDVLVAGALHFNLVVDVLSLPGKFPGCRGEELVQFCEDGNCTNGSLRRQCIDGVVVPYSTDPKALLTNLKGAIKGRLNELTDLSNDPVIVRVVATKQPCPMTEIDETLAVGCAYSCPVQLDNVDSISVSIDTLDDFCEPQVRGCAAFPRRPR
jgi:hypothetical protein